ncbi:MAG: UMP kinase [Candidatus Korarchaeota archaeon]|nr:UMP kinase [Candidatus Korarchaeota archaeon]
MTEGFVLLLGGHVFKGITNGDFTLIERMAKIVRDLSKDRKLAIVTGGSDTARRYIEAVGSLGGSKFLQDQAGILATRLHALVMIAALGKSAFPRVIEDYDEAALAFQLGKIPVSGGMQPGQSTDAVAALMAERLGLSFLVKMTGVDGVYDKDPTRYQDARKIEELSYDDLERILRDKLYHPGRYELLDALSIKILKRSSISTIILSGDEPEALLDLVSGKRTGSLVKPR